MRGIRSVAFATCLLASAGIMVAAESHFVPVVWGSGSTGVNLYWMKLDQNGHLKRGPVLVVNSGGLNVYAASITREGNKVVYTQSTSGPPNQIYTIDVNPKNGKVTHGPVALTTGAAYSYYGLGISSDGRKLAYERSPLLGPGNEDLFLRKFNQDGSPGKKTFQLTNDVQSDFAPFITEDMRRAYYCARLAGSSSIYLIGLKPSGARAGSPILVLTVPGHWLMLPRLDSTGKWLSYYDATDWNVYLTRLSTAGIATGTPIKLTSAGASQEANGGITRSASLLVYSFADWLTNTYTLYSQKLDANGNPTGAPVVLVPATASMVVPWIWGLW